MPSRIFNWFRPPANDTTNGASAAASAGSPPSTGAVAKTITAAEFPEAIKQGKVVVEFFSYGCGFCRRAQGAIEQAAKQLASADTKVFKVSVDDPAGRQLGIRHGLSYFPTFAVFENGKHVNTFAREGNNDVTTAFVTSKVQAALASAPRMNRAG